MAFIYQEGLEGKYVAFLPPDDEIVAVGDTLEEVIEKVTEMDLLDRAVIDYIPPRNVQVLLY
ncbi:MAG: hypothetical protein GXO07_00610 [Crenarchaeota archaeon]|nr:hypothetical protein [Thermoproteota archaeon]